MNNLNILKRIILYAFFSSVCFMGFSKTNGFFYNPDYLKNSKIQFVQNDIFLIQISSTFKASNDLNINTIKNYKNLSNELNIILSNQDYSLSPIENSQNIDYYINPDKIIKFNNSANKFCYLENYKNDYGSVKKTLHWDTSHGTFIELDKLTVWGGFWNIVGKTFLVGFLYGAGTINVEEHPEAYKVMFGFLGLNIVTRWGLAPLYKE